MNLIISLAAVELFLLLCAKPLKKRPGLFYAAAALASAVCTGLYWAAPERISPAALAKLPLWLGALGAACFIEVMAVGAMPNGHPKVRQVMPVRGELSIFACLLTLGQNLSYGRNYFAPGFLFSGAVTATKIAAWVSLVMVALMLALTVTSIKAVRRRFSPKRWKALQRWAYLFYALIYVHVLLMTVPGFLKRRGGSGLTLLAYSAVFLSYAVCRVRKAVLLSRGQAAKVTSASQLAAAGLGAALSLALTAGLYLSIPASPAALQTAEPLSQGVDDAGPADMPEEAPESPLVQDSQEEDGDSAASPEELENQEEEPEDQDDPVETASQPEEAGPDESEESQPVTAAAEPEASGEERQEETAQPETASEPESPPEQEAAPEESQPQAQPEEEPEPEPEPASKYQDGAFTGSGEGYYGTVTVSVTISGDVITSINVTGCMDDGDYFGDAQSGVVPAILSAQSPDVSAVSGATYSSKGIMAAVRDALSKAEN